MASKYILLAEHLEQAIASGEYKPGTFLPGERSICSRFQVSRVTVRKALSLLVEKKLAVAMVGSGYKVQNKNALLNPTKSHLVGGVFAGTQVSGEFMYVPSRLAQVISQNLGDNYNLVLANSEDNLLKERDIIQRLLRANMDGLIIMPSFGATDSRLNNAHECGNYALFQKIFASGIPVVLVDRCLTSLNNLGVEVPGVYNDDIACGKLQAQTMLNRGFRKIIFYDFFDRIGFQRYTGYCQALRQAGLKPLRICPNVLPCPDVVAGDTPAYQGEIERLTSLIDEDTAVICSCFFAPALDAAFPEHFCNGHRIAWICSEFQAGWGNLPLQPYPCAVRPLNRIAVLAAQKMLALLSGNKEAEKTVFLPPEIVE